MSSTPHLLKDMLYPRSAEIGEFMAQSYSHSPLLSVLECDVTCGISLY